MASKAQVPTGSISFQTQEHGARRAPRCPQLGGCSSTTGLARGSASSCHGQDCDTTFITRERDVESRAQSQPPAPRASGWQEPSTAGRLGAQGAACTQQHTVAYQQDASWGIPLRRQVWLGIAVALCRPGTAEMSCWQTACAQGDFAKSWVGG